MDVNVTLLDVVNGTNLVWTVGMDKVVENCSSVYFAVNYYPNKHQQLNYSGLPFKCLKDAVGKRLIFTLTTNSSAKSTLNPSLDGNEDFKDSASYSLINSIIPTDPFGVDYYYVPDTYDYYDYY